MPSRFVEPPPLYPEGIREAKAILEREGYQINLATQIPMPNLMIPDWLIHDYIITGEVTNVHRS